VVKDASSDSEHRPAVADGVGRESDDERVRSPAHNLTQLLAASIVRNQASKDRAGAPTNAELTSLADLVPAAAAQRTITPASKDDGLSTLTQPFFAPLPLARHRSISATTMSRCRFPPLGASPSPKRMTAGFAGNWVPQLLA
jgi:hypothetical protein